ncbi:hypothetical protein TNCV_2579831 [Trichonephila clavipes]|uniref:Uncharacterized protein n=1 Tax=Trichonephila clavipes TaxID=2585209 RepID=A0A8X6S937_TRICX|nr:hypothetical protein TNCV_2579831 [Trichonephila clavipes]
MAVIQFNKGFRGLLDVLNQAQIQVGVNTVSGFAQLDEERINESKRHSLSETECSLRTGCFAAEHNIDISPYPPTNPDKSPCYFWLYHQLNPLMVMNELSSQSSSASECAQTNSAPAQDFDRNGYKRVLLA